jgi:hypothetical protein
VPAAFLVVFLPAVVLLLAAESPAADLLADVRADFVAALRARVVAMHSSVEVGATKENAGSSTRMVTTQPVVTWVR